MPPYTQKFLSEEGHIDIPVSGKSFRFYLDTSKGVYLAGESEFTPTVASANRIIACEALEFAHKLQYGILQAEICKTNI